VICQEYLSNAIMPKDLELANYVVAYYSLVEYFFLENY
jgi:hypothetical protein